MKRLARLIAQLLLFAVVAGTGYLGFNGVPASGASGLAGLLGDVLGGLGLRRQPAVANLLVEEPTTVAASRGEVRQTVIAPGHLVVADERPLAPDVGGELAELHVRPGDTVRDGEVLARLEPAPYELALQEAQLNLAAAQVTYQSQLREAKLAVEMARIQLAEAKADHPRQLAEAQLDLQAAQARLAEARLGYPSLTAAQVRLDNATAAQYAGGFSLTTRGDILGAQQESARTFALLLTAMAAISLLVGGIGIMNVMLVSVTERTREIGIRMAVGARRLDVVSQFLLESVMLSAGGGVLGIAVGILSIPLAASLNQGNALLAPSSIPLAFAVALLTGVLFGLYPAVRAAHLDPIEALRYE